MTGSPGYGGGGLRSLKREEGRGALENNYGRGSANSMPEVYECQEFSFALAPRASRGRVFDVLALSVSGAPYCSILPARISATR
jgi:hypothetical protein